MRLFLFIFIVVSTFDVKAQLSTGELNAIFTRISEKDQSHLGKDSTDISIRLNMFIENFDTIKYLLQTHQLVGIKERLTKKQYRNYEGAIGITFTHIWQIYPALILNDDFVAFLKQEIDAKRFDVSVLYFPCSYAIYKNPDFEHPLSMEKKLYEAFEAWGIDRSKLFTGK